MKKKKTVKTGLKQKRPRFYLAQLLVKMLMQLSSHLMFHPMLQFHQHYNRTAETFAHILYVKNIVNQRSYRVSKR